jgi:predicted ATPase
VWSASDGALLMLAFLALAHSSTPEILLFEEPATGLHPSRIPMLVGLLRKITTGELGGRPRQVIISTYNPVLLNHIRPNEARIVHREAGQGTSVTSVGQIPNINRLLFGYGLGDIWAHIAEEGFLMQQSS